MLRQYLSAYLALCAIFRNEHTLIREWVAYHHWIGVRKFYIFDHGSVPPLLYTIQDFVEQGLVEYHYFNNIASVDYASSASLKSPQSWVYDKCFKLFGQRHKFIGLIDIDEFIIITDPKYSQPPNITAFLEPFEPYAGLSLYWKVFGSSNRYNTSRDKGALASYTSYIPKEIMAQTIEFSRNPMGFTKSIINTNSFLGYCNPHACAVKNNMVNSNYQYMKDPGIAEAINWDRIVLYHYQVQSVQEFRKKVKRGSGHTQFLLNKKAHGKTWRFFDQVNMQAVAEGKEGLLLYEQCCQNISLWSTEKMYVP
jgi:hypothetical protein